MIRRRPFVDYVSPVFVESGSHLGDGVAMALEADFKTIFSYEVAPHYVTHCRQRFTHLPQVHILAKSSVEMWSEIENIEARITFWLDGHFSGGDTSFVDQECPIMKELAVIRQHPKKEHIILIDDVRLFGTPEFNNISLDTVKHALMDINPKYTFELVDGHVPRDILVAQIK